MSLNQGKYKPSIAVIDEVDDRNFKSDDLPKQQQIEGSETAPLTAKKHKLSLDDKLPGKDIESHKDGRTRSGHGDGAQNSNGNGNGSVNGIRAFLLPGRLSIDALMGLSRKRRIMYITTACLCAVLLVIIIFMIAFWPEVPFYLKAELCLEKECVDVGRQILLWANTSKRPCQETYDWACGNFANEYADNDYYVMKRGEWNYKTYNEYQELNELNRLISMLPTSGVSYSVESMILSLYRSCREIDALDKSQSDLLLKKAMNSVDGWQAFRDSNRLQNWEYKKALVFLQAIYGIFPYYKISVENRFNKPHEYVIAIDEGDIGLPDKYFYNIDQNDEIVRGYKLLLRDFAINMGIVARKAELFADEVFHYEKRIVNHIDLVKGSNGSQQNEIKTLAELKSIAPSLPIFDSLIAIFPHTKITEDTEILVRNVEILHELSTVVSTSDKKPIYNFIIWSMARRLLPHLSKEYRTLVENFDQSIYGRTATYPRWMVCTKIVRDWLPFAVDALKEREETKKKNDFRKMINFPNRTYANDEVLQLMVHSLRNQLQTSIDEASWIDKDLKKYIKDKLTTLRIQIGIPREALVDRSYIQSYYNELLLSNIFFVEHLESIWSFRKSLMENKLKSLGIVETIISELYTRDEPQSVTYSNILNMLILSRSIVVSRYYDYRYPISVNFARIGADVLETLIDSIPVFIGQFNAERRTSQGSSDIVELAKVDVDCLVADERHRSDLNELSGSALKSFRITLSAAKIAARALTSFINAIDSSSSISGTSVGPGLNYENLRLKDRKRVAGLRSYGENELFTLAYMQKHCSTSIAEKDYARIKSHVEQRLPERYLFNATWNHIQFLKRSSRCSVPEVRCSNIL